MKNFWCSSFNSYYNGVRALYSNGHAFQRLPLSLLYSTSSTSNKGNNNSTSSSSSLLVNYLVESLDFSTDQSLSTCAKLFKSRNPRNGERRVSDNDMVEKATSVVHFFKKYGFQKNDISKIIIREPSVLFCKIDETLKPKFKLLFDLGFSGSDLIFAISRNAFWLQRSLESGIHALQTVLGSDENVITVLKRCNQIYVSAIAKNLVPNIDLLQNNYQIPLYKIQKGIVQYPAPYMVRPNLFQEKVIRVEEKLGIPRDSGMFLYGIFLASSFTEKNFEDKCRIFRSFGWTQSDVIALIRRNPMCLALAQANIREKLDFLMNEVGFEPSYLAIQPILLTCSVKKRLLPRHRVLLVLKQKGLLKKDYSLASAARVNDLHFCKKFVLPFEEVHQLYAQLTGTTVSSLAVGI